MEDLMAHHDHADSWFLAQLKPNCAHVADRNLKRQGFRTFLPMEEGLQNRVGRFIPTLTPVFPGYVFVSFDIEGGYCRKISSTNGITQLVSFGNKPAKVPFDIVNQLMLRCDSDGKMLPPKLLKHGDQVRIFSGPFANFIATIDNITPDRRVWVLMEIMGGQTRVAINVDQLRSV